MSAMDDLATRRNRRPGKSGRIFERDPRMAAGLAGSGAADTVAGGPDDPEMGEARFQEWARSLGQKLKINPNPDDSHQFYDYRGFFNDMMAGKPGVISPDQPGGHFPSTYKLEGHPRTYLQDSRGRVFDTRSNAYLNNGQQVPDGLPTTEVPAGFDPARAIQLLAAWRAAKGGVP